MIFFPGHSDIKEKLFVRSCYFRRKQSSVEKVIYLPLRGKQFNRILQHFDGNITGPADIVGAAGPSMLFYLSAGKLARLLSDSVEHTLSERSLRFRKKINPFFKRVGPLFLEHRQVFENRNALMGISEADAPQAVPDEPVIWCANHGFKDDVAATVISCRHAYILFGSLPMFFNTFDGLSA